MGCTEKDDAPKVGNINIVVHTMSFWWDEKKKKSFSNKGAPYAYDIYNINPVRIQIIEARNAQNKYLSTKKYEYEKKKKWCKI